MSTHNKVDSSALGWVKGEIDETLKQARIALEGFIDNPADATRLRFCATHLHQIVGTLRMVELDGAALVAREIEALADSCATGSVAPNESALTALTHGMLALPDYLARLQFGQPDMPLRQLPLINELRAARGVEPASELEFFAPDLSVRPPRRDATTRLTDAEYAVRTKELRSAFQAALLAWLRAPDNVAPLQRISAIFDELETSTSVSALEQLFWVAGGLIEALIDNGIDRTGAGKKQLARLDQHMKRIIDGASKSELRSGSEAITRAILFELGHATSSGARVSGIGNAFELNAWFGASTVGPAGDSADQPTVEVLASIGRILGKEIEQAQDLLATAFDPRKPDIAAIQPMPELLRKMAGMLEMLGQPALKALVDELAETCRALLEQRISDPAAASMPMAQALLLAESGAADMQHTTGDWQRQVEHATAVLRALHTPNSEIPVPGIEVAETELSDFEFKQLLGVVATEIGVNLGKVEEAIEAFAANPAQHERLDEIPGYLGQVQGALTILGLERAVALTTATRVQVETMRADSSAPSAAALDALAVRVGTIGAYIEGLRAGRKNLDALLDAALEETKVDTESAPAPAASMSTLLVEWLAESGDAGRYDVLRQQLQTTVGDDKTRRIRADVERLLELVARDPDALSTQVIETLRQSCVVLDKLAETPGTPAPVITPPPPPAVSIERDEDFDREILLIFIEDARDVFGRVTEEFEHFRVDTKNTTALAELRRGYHTLKGSGRMVGATQIAEFAWAIENLLNYVRDGKVETTPEVLALIERAQAVLPALIASLEGGPGPTAEVEAVRREAWARVGHGEPVPLPPKGGAAAAAATPVRSAPPAPVAQPPVVAPTAAPTVALPTLDATLLDIFNGEARVHLAALQEEIAKGRASGRAYTVNAALTRAAHTLAGNARSIGIPMMAAASAEVEKMLRAFDAHMLPLAKTHIDLIEQLVDAVEELLGALADSRAPESLARRLAGIARSAQTEHERVTAMRPPVETTPAAPGPVATVAPVATPNPEASTPPTPPAPVRAVTSATSRNEAVDPELLAIFQEEAVDILEAIDRALHHWRDQPTGTASVPDLKRALHTLKGGARMAGAMTMGDIAHETETLLQQVENGTVAPGLPLLELLDEAHDTLVHMLEDLARNTTPSDSRGLAARLVGAGTGVTISAPEIEAAAAPAPVSLPEVAPLDEVVPLDEVAPEVPPARVEVETPVIASMPPPLPAETVAEPAVADRRGDEMETWSNDRNRRGQVRVNATLLDDLVNHAGEVSIARSRMEQKIYGFRDNFSELNRNVTRFREQLRELEIQSESQILYRLERDQKTGATDEDFDPLELDRFSRLQHLARGLGESLHDLSTIQMSMGTIVGEAETVLQQQARINTELQQGLMRTRMVAFSTQAARLRHITRSTARDLGKRADLTVEGGDVSMDRTVLERMIGPFEHMIRNSLDHGLESEEERRRAGKPSTGSIRVAIVQEGNEIVIRFSDDGAGLNTEKIYAKAIERGMIAPNAKVTSEQLIQFILMPGFSTANAVTQVSGRGVGMDVVHNEVKQLGGGMAVDTRPGVGTTFTVRLPLTLSIMQALMAYVGDQTYAIPIVSIENIVEFPVTRLDQLAVSENPIFVHNDRQYDYLELGRCLGVAAAPRGRNVPVLLLRGGVRPIALRVDGLGGTREIVVKPLGSQLAEIRGITGATLMGDGRVILILDPVALSAGDEVLRVEHAESLTVPVSAPVVTRPVVMVVDDSLTVRKVTGKHLQKRGMEVLVAKDGIDAIEQLRDHIPDVMLIDIEMPRMDGYELTARVRADERLKHVPIIMITSRAGDKHRERAFELGVDMYMSKPYSEEELFASVDTLIANGRPH